MSEEIKERARAAAARILGTLPGCTTCVEAAGIIARLTRERDEARKYVNHFGRISEAQAKSLTSIVNAVRRYHPAGSPPSGDETVLTAWVLEQMHARATAAEAMVRELEERIVALEAQLTTRGACECGADDVCALVRRAQEAEAQLAMQQARTALISRLRALNACDEAIAWIEQAPGSPEDLWAACQRGDWMIWLLTTVGYDERTMRHIWTASWTADSDEIRAAAMSRLADIVRARVSWADVERAMRRAAREGEVG